MVEDGDSRPRAVLETTDIFTGRFDGVDADFAAAEGEGDMSLDYWRNAHRANFQKNGGFDPQMMLWCERFKLIEVLPVSE